MHNAISTSEYYAGRMIESIIDKKGIVTQDEISTVMFTAKSIVRELTAIRNRADRIVPVEYRTPHVPVDGCDCVKCSARRVLDKIKQRMKDAPAPAAHKDAAAPKPAEKHAAAGPGEPSSNKPCDCPSCQWNRAVDAVMSSQSKVKASVATDGPSAASNAAPAEPSQLASDVF